MSAAHPCNAEDRHEDGKPPTGRDHNPAGVLSLATVEEDGGNDAIAQDYEQRRPDEFGKRGIHVSQPTPLRKGGKLDERKDSYQRPSGKRGDEAVRES